MTEDRNVPYWFPMGEYHGLNTGKERAIALRVMKQWCLNFAMNDYAGIAAQKTLFTLLYSRLPTTAIGNPTKGVRGKPAI